MLLRNSACIMKTERPITKRRDNFFRFISLHILSDFQLNSIKTQGGDTKNPVFRKTGFCENWPFFAKNGQNFARFREFFYFSSYFLNHIIDLHRLGDFQHYLADIDGKMAPKVPKINQFWTPNSLIN